MLQKGDAPTITESVDTAYDYRVKFQGNNTLETPNLKGSNFFFGTKIVSTAESGVTAIIENSKLYDLYLNTDTDNLYRRTDYNPSTETSTNNHWVKIGTLKGKEGLNAYRTWCTIEGNEGKTIQQWVEETSGSAYEIQKVWEKPSILDDDTDLNVWYMYKTGKTLDADMFDFSIYNSDINGFTNGYSAGDKVALKVNVNGEDTWFPATIASDIPDADGEYRYIWQFTTGQPTTLFLIKYTGDLINATYDATVVARASTEMAGITTDGCPSGYTEIATTRQPAPNDAWMYISDPIDETLNAGKYAYWNGTSYVILNVLFSANPPSGKKPAVLWDERHQRAMLVSYDTTTHKYVLAYPFAVSTENSDHIPEGCIDASSYGELQQLGTWNQTIYVSPSGDRSNVNEVTLTTGANFSGVVMQGSFDEVIGTEDLHTVASTVKGAINELNDVLRTGTDEQFDTEVKNVIGAINELNGKLIDKSYVLGDVNKVLQIKPKTVEDSQGVEKTLYEPQATALKQTMTASETVSAGDILSANAVKNILDALMPIGMIVMGTKPTYGTWEKLTSAGGKALWGSDSNHVAGSTITAGLPNSTGTLIGYLSDDGGARSASGLVKRIYAQRSKSWNSSNGSACYSAEFDIANGEVHSGTYRNDIYGKSDTVQPPAYVVDVWIRTA